MTITYKDIRERKLDIEKERNARISPIYSAASALVDEYKESLELGSDTWADIRGISHPYVVIGIVNEEGEFQKKPLTEIKLTPECRLNFTISTVTDDSPEGGDTVLVGVTLFFDSNHVVNAKVGNQTIYIRDDRTDVCNVIKGDVMRMIDNPELRR
ncbi:hypothetical protein [Xenorhabdus bovienii]|uniref:hypothetical protein n=1 Tax=Xenorhabdus bovienii TaxID=40576 RepID=UPI0023B33373|nr:hypothetical protein [Xenorhabdus bovienii]MDE9552772.1 hypothetical protein [Xenorhabdus bovienii]